MKVPYISSLSISQALRYSMASAQSQLASAEREVSTGRLDDIGLTLGHQTGKFISLKGDMQRLETLIDTNGLASSRMKVSQSAISQIVSRTEDILSSTASGVGLDADQSVLASVAKTALADITAILNTSHNGDYIFSGVNSDAPPITDYETGPAKAAFDTAFSTFFGFSKDDAAAQAIDAATMGTFLDTVVEPQFLGTGWATNVSAAADDAILSRITLTQSVTTSVSANEDGFRQAVMASVITVELFSGNLGEQARSAVASKTRQLAGSAVGNLANLQGRVGLLEQQVTSANERLEAQIDILGEHANSLEAVDPYEASTRLTSLITQIETSYALTARIQKLSLMRFVS